MSPTIIAMPGNEVFANELRGLLNAEPVELAFRHFPDSESYVRVGGEVDGCDVLVTCTLHRPDDKVLPLFFLAETLKELGAARIGLVAPYLAYMRQDRRFQTGEGVTSRYFASMVSSHFDWLVTVDPHLHRVASLDDLYTVPTRVVHAAPVVAAWIAENVEQPLLVGPDEESAQWVAEVAKLADAPYTVLTKIRHGDRDVEVSVPEVERWRQHTPVLVDDIISTARTMIETIGHLRRAEMRPAVCVGVHGVFADDAAERLVASGAATVATTDTIPHSSNRLSVASLVADAVRSIFVENG